MEPVSPENQIPNEPIAVPAETPAVENPIVNVPAQDAEIAAPAVVEAEAPEKEEKEQVVEEEMKTEVADDKTATYEEEEEEEEEEIPEPEEEEWVSDEEVAPRRRGRRAHNSEDEDEEYGRSKRRKIIPVKKAPKAKMIIANESAGMKALRQYTSALKLGPRCFRGINKILDTKEREATLISRLHDCGRTWSGEYPSEEDIVLAKEETRQKKAEKARQYIIEEEDGVRSSRKAAQKARDFVKNLGEEDEDVVDEEIGGEVDAEIEEMNDEE